ncbi:PLDc N-terminal domain-containing protein [Pontibacter akesuensis]|uniref:Phospholipase_D-nuclease N-terminal n=1 Tax=Pontibacter akesuensis TaxID=388950 RepID=A0A1I7K6I3_9BACT|nr:PLDc N-terminal domain-containing protein [Pontibacter akesuensis]GHA74729.1 hypothetical protein GCM10007389_30630 [Pontibacter akesuensis]SFU92962.1 Phospholipase_D-nuclease N-terminal [Pontibacter akesuensis]
MLLFLGGLGGVEFLILLIPLALWLWALIDVLRSDFKSGTDKLVWVVAIIFVPLLGALLYLLFGRSQKVKHGV